MKQQIIIPWRSIGCAYRDKHFNFLVEHYSQEFEVIVGDSPGDFNRSAARNAGVNKSSSEVAVVLDADNYIPIEQIKNAIKVAKRRRCLVKPFKWFGYLTEESTDLFYELYNSPIDFHPTYIDPPSDSFNGGCYVINKELWQKLGGMDEEFVGWGGEDDAFHLICKNSGVKITYVDGYDYHLFHPAERVISDFNYNKLITEYENGNKSSRI